MILLLGVIEDEIENEGADSNGAGKSTIIEAVTLAIIGDVYRGVGKQDFIKENEKSCNVKMHLHNDVPINDITDLIIDRTFFNSGSSSKLRIWYKSANFNEGDDFEEKTDLSSSNEGNKFILDMLGINKDDFLNFYVIGQSNTKSFFLAGDARQKEIIGRFSNFDNIDELVRKIDIKINELILDIEVQEKDIENNDNFIQTNQQIIKDFEQNEKEEKIIRIKELKKSIKELKIEQVNCLNKIENNKITIESLIQQNIVLKSVINTIPNLQEKLMIIDKKIKDQRIFDKELNKKSSTLYNQLGRKVVCPKCNYSFLPNSDLSLDEVNKNIEMVEKKLISINSVLMQLDIDRTKISEQLDIANLDKSKWMNNNQNIDHINYLSKEIEKKVVVIKNNMQAHHSKLVNINKLNKNEEFLIELKSKLNKQVKEKTDKIIILKDLNNQLEEMKFFKFHFSRAGFKTYLANKSIKSIQDICNFYLNRFKIDLQVDINGYKILKDGSVRDKIEINLIKNGLKGAFNKYSGGQKSRVDLCGILTINKLINNTVELNKGLNLLMIDEIGDLDATGKFEIVKILSKSDITCVLVLHEIKDIQYQHKIYVGYKNKESYIIEH